MRPIDADAFTIHVALYMAENAYLNDTALDVLKKISKWLDEAPAIDYAPVRHGEWEETGCNTFCTSCGEKPLYDYWGKLKLSKRCPNCGAMMDGGKSDG